MVCLGNSSLWLEYRAQEVARNKAGEAGRPFCQAQELDFITQARRINRV